MDPNPAIASRAPGDTRDSWDVVDKSMRGDGLMQAIARVKTAGDAPQRALTPPTRLRHF